MTPLLSIWFEPRKTIRYLIDNYDPVSVWILAILEGIKESINWASTGRMGERHDLDVIVLVILVAGPILGVSGNWFCAFFARWVGRKFGGKASLEGLLTVVVWCSLPVILLLPLWSLLIWSFGANVFSPNISDLVIHSGNLGSIILYFGYLFLKFMAIVWGLVIAIVGVSEAQGFTKWNAFANMILSGFLTYLILGLPIYFIFRF